ncbi:hypothetical protein JR316_0012603 [Psilocybe cubensis]|uniref:Uncharacterized protein n=1 Tax=Psilocybe cubensis TaxID=181762 RepID=A0ACB8GJD1_PSICU|nr:hypothetical protein JR316_0012603 [Psilocybe cubensis]KAH9475492.1 hypothetical protein JR316_0012603 [Psilocybe cubensis]
MNNTADDTFPVYIDPSAKAWPTVDLNWLAIRDRYMRTSFCRPLKWYRLSEQAEVDNALPIWDILQGLTSKTHPDISPAYHAFSEICDIALSPDIRSGLAVDCPQLSFLHDIVAAKMKHAVRDSALLLKHQNLFNFLFAISPENERMSMHKAELQVAQIVMMLFDQISREKSPHMLVDMPCARNDALRGYMISFGRRLSLSQHGLALLSQDPGITQIFDDILVFINRKLVEEMSSFSTSDTAGIPTLLFYTSALYAEECRLIISHFPKSASSFDSLLRALFQYRALTIDKGSRDEELERQLSSPVIQGSAYHEVPFSKKWWSCLDDFRHIPFDIPDSESETSIA